jgi:hypothetical protein
MAVEQSLKDLEWLKEKWGCFSASEMFKLLSDGKGEMFGVGAKTYIEEVAIEAYTMFNQDENVSTWSMEKGKMKEFESHQYHKNTYLMGLPNIIYCGGGNPVFKKYNEYSGCSPDSIINRPNGEIMFGAEYKNNGSKQHFRDLRLIDTSKDLLTQHKDDYTQVQFSMMCYGVDLWHWCSYNEYFPENDKMLLIECEQDKQFQDNLDIRLSMAIKIRNRIIEQRMNNYKGEISFK